MLPTYMTLDRSDGEAHAIDGLRADWPDEPLLLHPPLNQILQTLRRVERTRARGVLIAPDWKGQLWTPLLMTLTTDKILLGPYLETMVRTRQMTARGLLLPPGNAVAYLMGMRMTEENCFSTT
jgi:hypothetical protein